VTILSHLGSAAVLTERRLDSVLTGTDTPGDFDEKVWDEQLRAVFSGP
jgi:hypothetical protein